MENFTLMQDMTFAADKLRGSGLNGLTEEEPFIKRIMEKVLLSTQEETMLLIAMIDRQCSGKSSSISDLSNYFQCSAMEVVALAPAIKSLLQNGYIRAKSTIISDITNSEFCICPNVFDAIVDGKEICTTPQNNATEFDQYAFCDAIYGAITKGVGTRGLIVLTERLESEHTELSLVRELKEEIPDITARILFYVLCREFCVGSETTVSDIIQTVYGDSIGLGAIARKDIITEKHPLVKEKLVCAMEGDTYLNRKRGTFLQLTEKGIKMLFGDAADAYLKPCKCSDRYEFVRKVIELWSDLPRNPNIRDFKRFHSEIERHERNNIQLTFISNITKLVSDMNDRLLYYRVCDSTLYNRSMTVDDLLKTYGSSRQLAAMRELKENRNVLQKQGLVEISSATFFGDSTIILTDKGKELFFEEDIDLFEEKVSDRDLITCDHIEKKNLYFDPTLERQLSILRDTLRKSNLIVLQERLKNSNQPTGIAVLLYGLPGTGKTESVMQIARDTGRSVYHVDISQTKSCWFGESEKIIRGVFDKYRKLCRKSALTPILLFNEADAVFSKRKNTSSSNVAQTENAIQNIILEEMEKLDGILVATTNLADNLDRAFERRFLFKIRFDKPTISSKVHIWKDKIPHLSDEEAMYLATSFDFSGGEINNIARKAAIEDVVSGIVPDIARLAILCGEEKIANKGKKVGF